MGNSNFIPASNVSEKFTDDEYLSDFLTENCFYRHMVEDLKKCNVDLVSEDPLETIYNCICHLNNLFRVLRRPWSNECGKIQKACAYYVANAKPSKQENEAVIDASNGFVSSICYFTEWYDFICQMQQFLCHQEKELKRVFKKQKQKVVSNDKPSMETTTYCMTVGAEAKSMVRRMGNSKNFTRLSVYSSSGKKLLSTAILKGITDIRLV